LSYVVARAFGPEKHALACIGRFVQFYMI
jgi:hypothetical protein